jgi:hypothetical protein
MTMKKPENSYANMRSGRGRKTADRRIQSFGILISSAIHVGLIVLYASNGQSWAALSGRVLVEAPATSSMEGTQLVNLVEIEPPDPTADAPIVDALEEDEEEFLPMIIVPVVLVDGAPGDVVPAEPDPIPAAAVFRVRLANMGLFTVARPDLILLTPEQRMQLQLQGRLEAWNDSLNAAIAAEAALLDWTRSDGKGGRWGISPGKLHLGSITIPLPFGFGPNPWQAEQIAKRQARDDDILNHVQAQEVRASWKERAAAIRRRKERERERERARRAGRDTTRARRGGR